VLFDPLEEQFDLPAKVIVVNQGVLEVVEDDVGGTYRAVYTVKFAEAVFVLHCFQKKSKRGIATPKEDMDIIHARLKIAEAYVKELRK
jgi:phage-related protein